MLVLRVLTLELTIVTLVLRVLVLGLTVLTLVLTILALMVLMSDGTDGTWRYLGQQYDTWDLTTSWSDLYGILGMMTTNQSNNRVNLV